MTEASEAQRMDCLAIPAGSCAVHASITLIHKSHPAASAVLQTIHVPQPRRSVKSCMREGSSPSGTTTSKSSVTWSCCCLSTAGRCGCAAGAGQHSLLALLLLAACRGGLGLGSLLGGLQLQHLHVEKNGRCRDNGSESAVCNTACRKRSTSAPACGRPLLAPARSAA